eukprot:6307093-Prymnesium_polylepis.2
MNLELFLGLGAGGAVWQPWHTLSSPAVARAGHSSAARHARTLIQAVRLWSPCSAAECDCCPIERISRRSRSSRLSLRYSASVWSVTK